MKVLKFLFRILALVLSFWSSYILCDKNGIGFKANRTVKFSLISRRNQSGHLVHRLAMDKSSIEMPDNWNIDIESRFTECRGVKSVNLLGVYTVPPSIPTDYELFPGVGYYKFHQESASDFDAASGMCFKEGGHLAVINSDAESRVMKLLWKRHPETQNFKKIYAYVGIHDRLKEGEFVTIFGQPLNDVGFAKWAGPNPDNFGSGENCGSVTREGLLNDVTCNMQGPFICEFDLSWSGH